MRETEARSNTFWNAIPMRKIKTPSLSHILRAVFIGVVLFGFLSYSPVIILWLAGVSIFPPKQPVVEEPVYYDKDGRPTNKPGYLNSVGYERAAKEAISKHEDCRSFPAGMESGCLDYVDHNFFPPHIKQDWNSGKTTAQCRAEVSRYYEYRHHTGRGRGSFRMYPRELKECERYDNIRVVRVVEPLLEILRPLIQKVEDGCRISDEEKAWVIAEHATVMALPDQPYSREYLKRSEYLLQLNEGLVEVQGKERLNLSCAELWAGLERLRQDDAADVAEIRSFGNGVIADPNGRRNALNDQRINRLWDFSRYEHNIKRAGCDRYNVTSKAENTPADPDTAK